MAKTTKKQIDLQGCDLYQHPEYGWVRDNEGEWTPPVRLTYPCLATAKVSKKLNKDGSAKKPEFMAHLLLKKNDPNTIRFAAKLEKKVNVMLELFNSKSNSVLGIKSLFFDGDADNVDHEKFPWQKGCEILWAHNTDKPDTLIKQDGIVVACDPAKFEGGVLVRACVHAGIFASGVSYKLTSILLFADDGKRFAGGVRRDDLASLGDDDYSDSEAEAPAEVEADGEEEDTEEAAVEEKKEAKSSKPLTGRAAALARL